MKKKLLSIVFLLFVSFSYAQSPCIETTEWDGTSWNPIVPNISVIVTISGNYDTATHGSFSSCTLIINDTVTIGPRDFIRVRDRTTVNSELIVQHQGSFVQVSDAPNNFILGPMGNATVEKQVSSPFSTAVAYWSTPIEGKTVGETFTGTPSFGGYRYYFITENFQDLTYEENNNNDTIAEVGIDDIDDDNDDWNFAFPGLPMIPGVGYATRQAPGSGAGTYDYAFSGEFNNGIIEVPVTRNDENLSPPLSAPGIDANPIFIGNPYASAIDLEEFLIENTYDAVSNPDGILDGHVAIWSASAPPVNTNNGNQILNFSETDYFYMNFSGATFNVCQSLPFNTCAPDAGGAPDPFPDPSISSAQGFFANFSDDRPANMGVVVFNNAMRITNLNENFYRTPAANVSSGLDDKLWLNLNSPSGINENILLSYVEGATSGNDGRSYDLDMGTPLSSYSLLYFNIEGSNDKFRIQGKNPDDLNLNEEVPLGFFNSVVGPNGVQEDFAISISKMQGDFINNRTVFLVDNLLNVCHNLSQSTYFFSSEVGEFNDRFTIKYLDCNYSEACNAVFDEVVGFIKEKKKCGKYKIDFPKDYNFNNYNLVLTHEGVDIPLTSDTTFSFSEDGSYPITISVFDTVTKELCYKNEVIIEVDCFKSKCGTCEDAFKYVVDAIKVGKNCGKYKIKVPKKLRNCYTVELSQNGNSIPVNTATTISYTENGNYTLGISIIDKETGKKCFTGDTILTVDCFKDNNKNYGIKLFPNPAKGSFKVTLSDAVEKIQGMILKNLMGNIVKQGNSNTIYIDDVKPGVYFVEIITKTGKIYRKQLVVK